jgi:hypothetical protein
MMVVLSINAGKLEMLLEGGTPDQAAELCEKAGQAIRAKIAAESGPPAPQIYLPTSTGVVPKMPPGLGRINGDRP